MDVKHFLHEFRFRSFSKRRLSDPICERSIFCCADKGMPKDSQPTIDRNQNKRFITIGLGLKKFELSVSLDIHRNMQQKHVLSIFFLSSINIVFNCTSF